MTVRATPEGPGPSTIWRSSDGSEWRSAEPPGAGQDVDILASARTPTGAWVVAGREHGSGSDSLWQSDDGMTWEPTWARARPGWGFVGLVPVPSGVVLAESRPDARGTRFWHSVDGRDWTKVAAIDDGIVAISGGPDGVAALTRPADSGRGRDYPVSLLRSGDGFQWSTTAAPELEGKLIRKVVPMPDGQVLAIRRLNDITWRGRPTSLPPFILPEPQMTEVFAALHEFDALANEPALQFELALRPGDMVIFDNWRVLHGRRAFSGERRIAGGYVNHEDFESTTRRLNTNR